MFLDFAELKSYIDSSGIKQKSLAEKAGLGEVKLSMSLQGKRKLEAGEYAGICNALNVPMTKFMKLGGNLQSKTPEEMR